MRIPESVKIGPYVYAVVREENIRADDDQRLKGQADHMALKIRLDNNLLPQHAEETFLHEIIHCVETVYGMDFEEREIGLLSVGLMAVLRDNGLLNPEEAP